MVNPSIIDLHEDLLFHINHPELWNNRQQTSYEMLRKNKVRLTFATAFPVPPNDNYFDPITNKLIEDDLKSYTHYCDTNPDWQLVKNTTDLRQIVAEQKKTGLILHVEGLNTFADTADDWARLERWYKLGWRSLGIVWNLTNPLGGGTKDPVQGLTVAGKKIIEWAQDHRMIIDFAHMNAPTFADVAKLLKGPIIVSHGNTHALCPNPRNYTDEQLKLVAESGGVVGVFFAKSFLTGTKPATIDDVVNHLDHLRKVMGIEQVALGTDFGGIISGFVENFDSLDRLSVLWTALAARGYTDEMLEKIAYRNALRVLEIIL